MTSTASALSAFFNGFGVPAYSNNSVPDEIPARHITYSLTEPEWGSATPIYCEVWDRSTSNEFILATAGKIAREIGTGIVISCAGGFLRLQLENPVAQVRVDGDFRSAYMSMSLNAFHMPGV